ncbi:LOW QUALITY PROTEIN: muscle M-line assembly protein unc-89 [Procambarus clarkii]|uniref:LOW QUALITY PROTEIN: muscle M-line assembly protein unc-89 n=1 Tax=Procambarus clarkii TaxID=6728 RepID=UPI003742E21F
MSHKYVSNKAVMKNEGFLAKLGSTLMTRTNPDPLIETKTQSSIAWRKTSDVKARIKTATGTIAIYDDMTPEEIAELEQQATLMAGGSAPELSGVAATAVQTAVLAAGIGQQEEQQTTTVATYLVNEDYSPDDSEGLAVVAGQKVILVDKSSPHKRPRLEGDETGTELLDNSAARHKMAVRPKRNHPDPRSRAQEASDDRWVVRDADSGKEGLVPSRFLVLHSQETSSSLKTSLKRSVQQLALEETLVVKKNLMKEIREFKSRKLSSKLLGPSPEDEARGKRTATIRELIETEEEFVKDLEFVMENYYNLMDKQTTPRNIRDHKELIFNNFKFISDFHQNVLIEGVKYHAEVPTMIGRTFLRLERDFDKHAEYCSNEPLAQEFLENNIPVKEYFEDYSQRLGDDKRLQEHLKLPIQRLNDYQLLLRELVKFSSRLGDDTTDLQRAYELMQTIPQRATDAKFITSIEGFKGNLFKLGRLIRHDWFSVKEASEKSRDRYLFLFKARILITKVKRIAEDRSVFILKDIIRLPETSLGSLDKPKALEFFHIESLSHPNYPILIEARTPEIRDSWLSGIEEYVVDTASVEDLLFDDELRVLSQDIDEEDAGVVSPVPEVQEFEDLPEDDELSDPFPRKSQVTIEREPSPPHKRQKPETQPLEGAQEAAKSGPEASTQQRAAVAAAAAEPASSPKAAEQQAKGLTLEQVEAPEPSVVAEQGQAPTTASPPTTPKETQLAEQQDLAEGLLKADASPVSEALLTDPDACVEPHGAVGDIWSERDLSPPSKKAKIPTRVEEEETLQEAQEGSVTTAGEAEAEGLQEEEIDIWGSRGSSPPLRIGQATQAQEGTPSPPSGGPPDQDLLTESPVKEPEENDFWGPGDVSPPLRIRATEETIEATPSPPGEEQLEEKPRVEAEETSPEGSQREEIDIWGSRETSPPLRIRPEIVDTEPTSQLPAEKATTEEPEDEEEEEQDSDDFWVAKDSPPPIRRIKIEVEETEEREAEQKNDGDETRETCQTDDNDEDLVERWFGAEDTHTRVVVLESIQKQEEEKFWKSKATIEVTSDETSAVRHQAVEETEQEISEQFRQNESNVTIWSSEAFSTSLRPRRAVPFIDEEEEKERIVTGTEETPIEPTEESPDEALLERWFDSDEARTQVVYEIVTEEREQLEHVSDEEHLSPPPKRRKSFRDEQLQDVKEEEDEVADIWGPRAFSPPPRSHVIVTEEVTPSPPNEVETLEEPAGEVTAEVEVAVEEPTAETSLVVEEIEEINIWGSRDSSPPLRRPVAEIEVTPSPPVEVETLEEPPLEAAPSPPVEVAAVEEPTAEDAPVAEEIDIWGSGDSSPPLRRPFAEVEVTPSPPAEVETLEEPPLEAAPSPPVEEAVVEEPTVEDEDAPVAEEIDIWGSRDSSPPLRRPFAKVEVTPSPPAEVETLEEPPLEAAPSPPVEEEAVEEPTAEEIDIWGSRDSSPPLRRPVAEVEVTPSPPAEVETLEEPPLEAAPSPPVEEEAVEEPTAEEIDIWGSRDSSPPLRRPVAEVEVTPSPPAEVETLEEPPLEAAPSPPVEEEAVEEPTAEEIDIWGSRDSSPPLRRPVAEVEVTPSPPAEVETLEEPPLEAAPSPPVEVAAVEEPTAEDAPVAEEIDIWGSGDSSPPLRRPFAEVEVTPSPPAEVEILEEPPLEAAPSPPVEEAVVEEPTVEDEDAPVAEEIDIWGSRDSSPPLRRPVAEVEVTPSPPAEVETLEEPPLEAAPSPPVEEAVVEEPTVEDEDAPVAEEIDIWGSRDSSPPLRRPVAEVEVTPSPPAEVETLEEPPLEAAPSPPVEEEAVEEPTAEEIDIWGLRDSSPPLRRPETKVDVSPPAEGPKVGDIVVAEKSEEVEICATGKTSLPLRSVVKVDDASLSPPDTEAEDAGLPSDFWSRNESPPLRPKLVLDSVPEPIGVETADASKTSDDVFLLFDELAEESKPLLPDGTEDLSGDFWAGRSISPRTGSKHSQTPTEEAEEVDFWAKTGDDSPPLRLKAGEVFPAEVAELPGDVPSPESASPQRSKTPTPEEEIGKDKEVQAMSQKLSEQLALQQRQQQEEEEERKKREREQARLDKEREEQEKQEKERLEKEKKEREEKEKKEREEKEKLEKEKKEKEEKEKQEKERKEKERLEREKKEREEKEKKEREEKEKKEREEKERLEKERLAREKKEKEEKEKKEKEEREKKEKEEKEKKEREEKEKKEKEEKERLEKERLAREKKEQEEKEKKEREEKERKEREEKERLAREKEEKEKKEREEKERKEREEKEKKEREEKERLAREKKEKEEKEKKEREEKERLAREKKEKEEKEKKEREEKERKEREEKERLAREKKEKEEKEKKEREEKERLAREKKEKEEKEKKEREEKERLAKEEKERKEREEKERLAKEEKERKEREEKERKEKEEKERKEKEEKERKEKEEKERLAREKKEREEKERKEKEEKERKEREEKEKKEREEKERLAREKKEKEEKEKKEREEKERLAREKKEKEEKEKKEREEKERLEREKKEKEEKARLAKEKKEREEKERKEKEEKEKKEREEKERLEREKKEREEKERLERDKKEREEKERKEREEKERLLKEKKEKEEKLRKEKEQKERLEKEKREKEEKERKEKEEEERLEKERKEKEDKERKEKEEREKKEREERELKEKAEKERLDKERKQKEEKERKLKEERDLKEKEELAKKEREEKERKDKEERERASKPRTMDKLLEDQTKDSDSSVEDAFEMMAQDAVQDEEEQQEVEEFWAGRDVASPEATKDSEETKTKEAKPKEDSKPQAAPQKPTEAPKSETTKPAPEPSKPVVEPPKPAAAKPEAPKPELPKLAVPKPEAAKPEVKAPPPKVTTSKKMEEPTTPFTPGGSPKPVFTKTLRGDVVEPGEGVTFSCEVAHPCPYFVTWLKDSKPLDDKLADRVQQQDAGDRHNLRITDEGNKHTLKVMNCRVQDSGIYTAKATDEAGAAATCSAQLLVQELTEEERSRRISEKSPFFLVRMKPTEVIENTNLSYTIHVKGDPMPDVQFFKDDKEIKEDARVRLHRDHASGHYELLISHVQRGDEGTYKCLARNKFGRAECQASMSVNDEELVYESLSGKGSLLAQGEKAEFKWFRDGQEFDPLERFNVMFKDDEDTLALVFQNVTPEDAGLYTCVASTSCGKISCSAELTVEGSVNRLHRDPEPPSIKEELTDTQVAQGGSAMLECKIGGFPKPDLQWTKNGLDVKAGGRFKFLWEDEESVALVIKNVEEKDAGLYRVVAKNELGEVQCSAKLGIKAGPKIKSMKKEVACVIGQNLEYNVEVEGEPAPEVKWLKDGKKVVESDRIKFKKVSDCLWTLNINSMQMDDCGCYTVVAANSIGQVSEFFNLQTDAAPQITRGLDPETEKKLSNDLTLEVRATGSPQPDARWFKNGKEIMGDEKFKMIRDESFYTLKIRRLERKDKGTYKCELTNTSGSVSTEGELTVRAPPDFITPLKDVCAKEGSKDAKLFVEWEANPKPSVKWFLNDKPIREETPGYTIRGQETTQILTINEATPDFVGTYTVKASNEYGESVCKGRFRLHEAPAITEGLKDVEFLEDTAAKFTFKATGIPLPEIKWTKDGKKWSPDERRVKLKVENEDTFSLVFEEAKPEDSGLYVATVSNVEGSTTTEGTIVVNTPPHIIKSNFRDGKTFIAMHKFLLEVEATAVPEAQATWFCNGKKLSEEEDNVKFTFDGTKYTLERFGCDPEHSGEYKCVLKNKIKEVEEVGQVIVKEKEARVRNKLEDVFIKEFTDATIKCQIVGDPIPEVQWLRNGKPLPVSEKFEVSCERMSGWHTLVIKNVEESDTCSFTIKGKNQHGECETSCRMGVLVKPQPGPLQDATVDYARDLHLVVNIHAIPPPTMVWSLAGKELKDSDHFEYTRDEEKENYGLVIHSAVLEDAGKISFTASNAAGSESGSCTVTVHTEKPSVVGALENLDYCLEDDVTFTLRATGLPLPECQWKKNGVPVKEDSKHVITNPEPGVYCLTIKDINPQDYGEVTVTAKSLVGECSSTSKLIQKKLPCEVVEGLDNVTPGAEGDDVTLTVKIRASPRPDFVWTKDGDVCEASEKIKIDIKKTSYCEATISLTLVEAGSIDSGQYRLKLSNEVNETSTETALIVRPVRRKPKITKKPEDVHIMDGKACVLRAKITGFPKPQVQWLKDGHQVYPTDLVDTGVTAEGLYYLEFKVVSEEDAGRYTVVAANDEGTVEADAVLTVTPPPSRPEFLQSLKASKVILGYPVRMEVKLGGSPRPEVQWLKDGQPVNLDGKHFKQIVDPDGTVILQIDSASEGDMGEFTCVAKNAEGDSRSSATLSVLGFKREDGQPDGPARFSDGLKDVSFDEGQTITLPVAMKGGPVPAMKWFKDGEEIKLGERAFFTYDGDRAFLEVRPAIGSDSGKYKCVIENPHGSAETECEVTIRKSFEEPCFTSTFPSQSKLPGHDVKMSVKYDGVPLPELTWYFNGKPIVPDGDKFRIRREGDGQTLYLKDCTYSDSGKYKVVAKNREGQIEHEAELEVADVVDPNRRAEAPVFLKAIGDQEVFEGSKALFKAIVVGRPEPEYKWYKNGGQVIGSNRVVIEKDPEGLIRLSIRHVTSEDSGVYSLKAWNEHGEASCQGKLICETLTSLKKRPVGDEYQGFDRIRRSGVPMPLPEKPMISALSDRRATISWMPYLANPHTQPVTYHVEMCESPEGEWVTVRTGIRGCSVDITNLLPKSDYKFRVRVANKYGVSEPSPYAMTYRHKLELPPISYEPKMDPNYDFRGDGPYVPEGFKISRDTYGNYYAPPRFLRLDHDTQYGLRGFNAYVKWYAYGYPLPKVRFLRDNKPLDVGGKGRFTYTQESTGEICLYIDRMTESDVGRYECIVTNEHGESRQRIQLALSEYPRVLQPLEEIHIKANSSGRIMCRISGYPPCEVKWFRDWEPITPSFRFRPMYSEPDWYILNINGASTKDAGLYSVAAVNVAGSVHSSCMVHVQEDDTGFYWTGPGMGRQVAINHRRGTLEDHYDVGDEIGRGTQGVVYHCVEHHTGRNFAAKSMWGKDNFKTWMRLEYEMMNLNNSCKQILRLYDAYEGPKNMVLVTHLCGGGDLLGALTQRQHLTEYEVCVIIRQVLLGLDYMHDHYIAHLGLNIGDILLVRPNGLELKIGDLSLARQIKMNDFAPLDYGMPEFVAPEVANNEGVAFSADMWAVGIITYILLSGTSPFR